MLREAGDAVVRRAPGEAARWYRAAIDLLPAHSPPGAADLWAALGGALGAAGDLADARSALVSAIDLLPADAVATHVVLTADCARLEHNLGHHDTAHRRLTAALERTGDAYPAESVMLMVAIALDHNFRAEYARAVDWRVHHRTTPGDRTGVGIGALTEREFQVARLIQDRRTNAEIAAELHLSTKTVETHVRSLFHKLAANSRVEVARIIERQDHEPP